MLIPPGLAWSILWSREGPAAMTVTLRGVCWPCWGAPDVLSCPCIVAISDLELLNSWLDRHGPRPGQADQEAWTEEATSTYIGAMPFLWLAVEQRDDRGCVERNSVALTSRLADGLDQPSAGWLGHDAAHTQISQSGLWNRCGCSPEQPWGA